MLARSKFIFGVIVLVVMVIGVSPALAVNLNGTTLSADKTAVGHWEREFEWTIDKSVSPESWDLFRGDSGTSAYVIEITKSEQGTDTIWVSGEICVTNGGAYPTENLAILDEVEYNPSGGTGFLHLTDASVDLSEHPVLAAGESWCYPYEIEFTPVAGAVYRNTAHVTITNHAGWLPDDGTGNCDGPELCPFGPEPKADFSLPGTPTLINDEINVSDTYGPALYGPFSASDTIEYERTFTCDDDAGTHDNTATIVETGEYDDASVDVDCYALNVRKSAYTTHDRTYHWDIEKVADQDDLNLAAGQEFDVNYVITVNLEDPPYTDGNFAVHGVIGIRNPAPMDATLNSVEDVVSVSIAATVNCGVTWPHTLPAGTGMFCTYQADLPDATTRTNTATAELQNYDYDSEGIGTASGTTVFSGTAPVSFDDPTVNEIDECIDVSDTYAGFLDTVCAGDVLPVTFRYTRTLGPYEECDTDLVVNTASYVANDSGATEDDIWNVLVTVPCPEGCTLTLGYWKNHAGFGPQDDMVTALLPQYLGTQALGVPIGKSLKVDTAAFAVQLLSFEGSNDVFNASNGINKLYAQLLAAKLNIATGADGSAISATILAADAYLTTHNSLDWASLNKAQKNRVLNWMIALDRFNNGLSGPGHCSE